MEQQVGQGENIEALPQPIEECRQVDVWEDHVNHLYYRLRGNGLRRLLPDLRLSRLSTRSRISR